MVVVVLVVPQLHLINLPCVVVEVGRRVPEPYTPPPVPTPIAPESKKGAAAGTGSGAKKDDPSTPRKGAKKGGAKEKGTPVSPTQATPTAVTEEIAVGMFHLHMYSLLREVLLLRNVQRCTFMSLV